MMVFPGNCPDESFLHVSQISSHCLRMVSRLLTVRFQFRAFVVDIVRVKSLFDQSVALFLGQVHAMNTLPLELCPCGVEFVIHEILVFDGLFVGIEIGRLAIRAIEGKEGIAVDVIGGRSGQSNLPAVEIFQHFIELVVDRAMDFIEDDQVKEGGRELLEDVAQSLESHRIQALCAYLYPNERMRVQGSLGR